jgi:hypothetical protein
LDPHGVLRVLHYLAAGVVLVDQVEIDLEPGMLVILESELVAGAEVGRQLEPDTLRLRGIELGYDVDIGLLRTAHPSSPAL